MRRVAVRFCSNIKTNGLVKPQRFCCQISKREKIAQVQKMSNGLRMKLYTNYTNLHELQRTKSLPFLTTK